MDSGKPNYIERLVSDTPEVPIAQAIIFPNGDLFRFESTIIPNENEERIVFSEGTTIDSYFEQNGKENISHCYVTASTETGEYMAYAGEGSWGGDGIVYMTRKPDNQLVWFLFSDKSNPFYSIEIKEDTVVAMSTLQKRWTIPINSPQNLRIEV